MIAMKSPATGLLLLSGLLLTQACGDSVPTKRDAGHAIPDAGHAARDASQPDCSKNLASPHDRNPIGYGPIVGCPCGGPPNAQYCCGGGYGLGCYGGTWSRFADGPCHSCAEDDAGQLLCQDPAAEIDCDVHADCSKNDPAGTLKTNPSPGPSSHYAIAGCPCHAPNGDYCCAIGHGLGCYGGTWSAFFQDENGYGPCGCSVDDAGQHVCETAPEIVCE